ncbi:MAG: phosphatidate cytidylyltransferase [Fibrobacterales bacterium]
MNFINAVPQNLLISLAGIFGILVVASIITFLLKLKSPNKNFTELESRIKSWWVMVVIFSFAMIVSKTISIIFFAFMSYMAFKEFISLVKTRRADRQVIFLAYLAIPFQYYFVYIGWYGMFIVFIPVFIFLLLPARMVLIGETKGFLVSAAINQWGLMTMVFSLSHIAYFLALPNNPSAPAGGAGYVLFLVFLTQINDVCQYIWGKSFGKTKIIPKVSPNKTWAGFIGGVSTTVLIAYFIAPLLTELNVIMSIAAGLLIGVGGFLGDIAISALKRDLDKKDTGSIIPGHGGIMDRIDSLTYTAPLFFHFIYYLYY